MKMLSISLEVISPLAVRSDHAASRTANSEYIPGNTLLGSLATIHRVLRPEQTKEFEQFFLLGEMLYSNLYPSYPYPPTFESKESGWIEQGAVYPTPKTAQSCKRHEGFLPLGPKDDDDHGRDRHGVRDSLVDWALFKLGESYPSLNRTRALQENKICKFKNKKCSEPLDHFKGYYRYYRHTQTDQERPVLTKNDTRLQTHTGIDRQSGTVREGILYSRQVFEEGSKFWGEIRLPVDETLAISFNSFLWAARDSHLLRMGTGRTRGMGKVEIHFEDKETDTVQARDKNFRRRTKELNDLIHEKIKFAEAGAEDIKKLDEQFFFALTLHSPVILTDEFLRYRSRINTEVLCELLGITYDEQDEQNNLYNLKCVYSNFSNRRITGWQELWGTPRTNEYAIDTGAAFLFQCDRSKSEKVLDTLFNLEEQGIGNRRAEGFGRVCVSDPFHLRSEQE
jgi:CRISPR-associated protein Csx10